MERYFDLLKFAIRALSYMGISPYKRNFVGRIVNFALIAMSVQMSVMVCLELIINWEGVQSLGRVLLLPGIIMILGKATALTMKRDNIRMLLGRIEKLWPIDIFGPDVHAEMKRYCDIGYKLVKCFTLFCAITTILVILMPIFQKVLVFPVYAGCDLNTSPCYEIVYFWESVYLYLFALPLTVANDSLFASMILYAYVGIQMIKTSFRELTTADDDEFIVRRNISNIVEQHNILLNLIKEINDMFSEILFIQFSTSLISQIFCLFMLTFDGIPPDFDHVSMYGSVYIVHLLQLAIFCVGGTLIMDEANTIGDAAYDVAWYKKGQTKWRKTLALIILRSQRVDKITCGDILDLNLISYLAIVKNSVSIYGLMQTVSSTR